MTSTNLPTPSRPHASRTYAPLCAVDPAYAPGTGTPEIGGFTNRRNSAAYKGLHALLLRDGALDFATGEAVDVQTYFADNIDIHHIFPQKWCQENGIVRDRYDSIVNKTPLSARTNRIIGRKAPSVYLPLLQDKFEIPEERMDVMHGFVYAGDLDSASRA